MTANLGERLIETASLRPKHVALVDGEERLTWAEVRQRASVLAARLRAVGLRRSGRVAICTEHGLAQAIALFAVALADGIFTVVSPVLKQDQVDHQVLDCEATIVIGAPSRISSLRDVFARRSVMVVEVNGLGQLLDGVSADVATEAVKPSAIPIDVACLIYTSGSTGKPKGVVVPHRTLLDGGRIVSNFLKVGPDDVTLSILPLNFDYGLNQLMTAVTVAARVVFHRYILPSDMFAVLASENITGFAAVPSLWPNILHPRFASSRKPLPKLRYITTAGGAHSQSLLKTVSDAFPGTEIIVMYGLTESFRSCYLPFSEIFKRPGSIGRPVPEVEVLVLDKEGRPCPPGVKGELYHRGAFVNYGYLNDPALTAAKFVGVPRIGPGVRPEVMVRSGDIVEFDEDNYLIFHGRIDNQIKTTGFRVSPSELEEVGQSFDGLAECAAVGVPDEDLGEAIVVYYTTFDGQSRSEQALKAHFSVQLPTYALPRRFVHVSTLPQTSTGKIDYTSLRQMLVNAENLNLP